MIKVSDLRLGDVIECEVNSYLFLGEIVALESLAHWEILILAPKTFGNYHPSISEACQFWGFEVPNLAIPTEKLLQHNFCPIHCPEIRKKTDLIW